MEKAKNEKISIEEQMQKLQKLAQKIEDTNSSIDESFEAFQEAEQLIETIKSELNVYKKKAEIIVDVPQKGEKNDLE